MKAEIKTNGNPPTNARTHIHTPFFFPCKPDYRYIA